MNSTRKLVKGKSNILPTFFPFFKAIFKVYLSNLKVNLIKF